MKFIKIWILLIFFYWIFSFKISNLKIQIHNNKIEIHIGDIQIRYFQNKNNNSFESIHYNSFYYFILNIDKISSWRFFRKFHSFNTSTAENFRDKRKSNHTPFVHCESKSVHISRMNSCLYANIVREIRFRLYRSPWNEHVTSAEEIITALHSS